MALKRPLHPMSEDVRIALEQSGLMAAYQSRPPYQQNDYIGWIERAKQPQTRQKRLAQMLRELQGGNAYMGMQYHAHFTTSKG